MQGPCASMPPVFVSRVAAVLFGFAVAPCFSGEVNGANQLNSALASKPLVIMTKTETRPPTQAEFQSCVDRFGPFPIPNFAKCLQPITQTVEYSAPATVTDSFVVETSSLLFAAVQATSIPVTGRLKTKRIQNCADANLTDTITLTVSGQRGWQVQKSNTLSTTIGASASGSVGVPNVASGSISLSWSQTISSSSQTQESKSDTVTETASDTLTIGPRKALDAELFMYQASAQIPFHADITIDGNVIPNKSGITKASQLLTKAERTVPFDGVLQLDDVSHATFRTIPLTGAAACDGVAPSTQETVLSAQAAAKYVQSSQLQFAKSVAAKNNLLLPQVMKAMKLDDTGPIIGPPDGTSYSVLYTLELVMPDFGRCGFNDLAVPNPAVYAREARQYTTYANGILVSSEQRFVDVFLKCQSI
jgi:Clostridium epsilon toxin ETX/Bacillus mosquitocidal toxin MTX2